MGARLQTGPLAIGLSGIAALLLVAAGFSRAASVPGRSPGSAPSATASAERVVVALGDSLTAGFGVGPDEAWPALVETRLRQEGYPYRVVNAGVSGDTTAGGLRRVDWVLRVGPDVAVVALGANDGLRGLPVDAMRANLTAIVERLSGRGTRVLLAGMRVPSNYGDDYGRSSGRRYGHTWLAITRWPAGFGWMPSAWLRRRSAATPSRRNGMRATWARSATPG